MEADMSDKYLRLGDFEGNFVFRGAQYGHMKVPGYKEDFQLVPKEEEKFYLEKTLPIGQKWREPTVVSKFIDLPPLLKEMLAQEANEKKINYMPDELKLPFLVNTTGTFSNSKYE